MTLTREEILALEPGTELDKLVDEVIFKREFTELPMGWCYHNGRGWVHAAPYSFDITAAWKMESIFDQDSEIRGDYSIELHNVLGLMLHKRTTLDNIYQFVHATPEQRCKAALLAVLNL